MPADPKKKKERSRVFFAVLSLIFPGLGQISRGRIIAGLLFLFNVVLYLFPLVIKQDIDYDVQNPSLLIALVVWVCSAMDAFLYRSSFLVMALLVSLFCFGPEFESDAGEHLQIDFGIDTWFLPQAEAPGSARLAQSNIRSLLSLVHELDDVLAIERRRLETESGENFAERLQAALEQKQ